MLITERRLAGPIPEIAGRTVFVVGSGPSLDALDLRPLHDSVIFALNAAITLFDRRTFPLAHWVVRDRRAINQITPRLSRDGVLRLITTSRVYEAFQDAAPRSSVAALIYLENQVVHRRTVAEDALQLAARAGARGAVLVGVDCHAPKGQPYAKALMWKPCSWYDPAKPPAGESKACLTMLEALRQLDFPGLGTTFMVESTSATCDAFPYVPFADAVAGERAFIDRQIAEIEKDEKRTRARALARRAAR